MAVQFAAVVATSQMAIHLSRPAPSSRLLNIGVNAMMNEYIAVNFTRPCIDDDLRSTDDISSENR